MGEEALDLLNKARAIGEEGIGAVAEDVGGDSDIIAASASIRAWRLVQVSLPVCWSGCMLPGLDGAPSQTRVYRLGIWALLRVGSGSGHLGNMNLTCPDLSCLKAAHMATWLCELGGVRAPS